MIPLTSDGYTVDNRGPRIGSIGVVVTLAVGGELKLSHFVTLRKLGLCVFGVTALGSCLGRWCEESHPWFHWESRKRFFSSLACFYLGFAGGRPFGRVLQLVFLGLSLKAVCFGLASLRCQSFFSTSCHRRKACPLFWLHLPQWLSEIFVPQPS